MGRYQSDRSLSHGIDGGRSPRLSRSTAAITLLSEKNTPLHRLSGVTYWTLSHGLPGPLRLWEIIRASNFGEPIRVNASDFLIMRSPTKSCELNKGSPSSGFPGFTAERYSDRPVGGAFDGTPPAFARSGPCLPTHKARFTTTARRSTNSRQVVAQVISFFFLRNQAADSKVTIFPSAGG